MMDGLERFERFIRTTTDPAIPATGEQLGYGEWEYEDGTSMRADAIAWFARADTLAAEVERLEAELASETERLEGEAAMWQQTVTKLEADNAALRAPLAAREHAACPHCGKSLHGEKLLPF